MIDLSKIIFDKITEDQNKSNEDKPHIVRTEIFRHNRKVNKKFNGSKDINEDWYDN